MKSLLLLPLLPLAMAAPEPPAPANPAGTALTAPALPPLSAEQRPHYEALCAFLERCDDVNRDCVFYGRVGECKAVWGNQRRLHPGKEGLGLSVLPLEGKPRRRKGTQELRCFQYRSEALPQWRQAYGMLAFIRCRQTITPENSFGQVSVWLDGLVDGDVLLLPKGCEELLERVFLEKSELGDYLRSVDCAVPHLEGAWEKGNAMYAEEIRLYREACALLAEPNLSDAERRERLRPLLLRAAALDCVDVYNAGESICVALDEKWHHEHVEACAAFTAAVTPWINTAAGDEERARLQQCLRVFLERLRG